MRNLLESDNKVTGHSISFIDIDETTFHTYAKVKVLNRDGELVRVLDNQQFNTDVLKDGEHYDFSEFQDSKVFNDTSTPIEPIVDKIQRMIDSIKKNGKLEKVIFLTARSDFNDKELFLKTFRANGIDVDINNVYIERSGNLQHIKSVADRKRYVMLKYLQSGEYTAVRMIDDDTHNLEVFKELGKEINQGKFNILQTVKQKYPRVRKLWFYPLLVDKNGRIKNLSSTKSIKESVLMERIFPEIPELVYDNCLIVSAGYGQKPNAITKWLCQLISDNKENEEDLFPGGYTFMVRDYIELYKKYKKAGLIKDIFQYKSFDELKNEIIKIKNSGYKSNSKKEEEARNAVKLLLNEDSLKIMEINSWAAAQKYGKGTKWCTSSEITSDYFNSYSGDYSHLLYVFYNDKKYGVGARVYNDVYTDGKRYYYGNNEEYKKYKRTSDINIEIFDEKDNVLYSLGRMRAGTNRGEKIFDKNFLKNGFVRKDFSEELFFIIYKTILKTYAPHLYKEFEEKNN